MTKLTDSKVKKIKELSRKGLSSRVVGKRVGCSHSTVTRILNK